MTGSGAPEELCKKKPRNIQAAQDVVNRRNVNQTGYDGSHLTFAKNVGT